MYKLSQVPEEYKKKLITAEQAAALVRDGERVSYGLGCSARMISISKSVTGKRIARR